MTKIEAEAKGYCRMCAGFVNKKQLCGIIRGDMVNCQLPDDVRARWDDDINQAELVKRMVKFGKRK